MKGSDSVIRSDTSVMVKERIPETEMMEDE